MPRIIAQNRIPRTVIGNRGLTYNPNTPTAGVQAQDPDAAVWLGKGGGAPTTAYANSVHKLFLALKACGAWDSMVAGYIHAAPNTAGALANIKGDATKDATSSATVTPLQGFNNLATTVTFPGTAGANFISTLNCNVVAVRIDQSQASTEVTNAGHGRVMTDATGTNQCGPAWVGGGPQFQGGRAGFAAGSGFVMAPGKMQFAETNTAMWLPFMGPTAAFSGGGSFSGITTAARWTGLFPLSVPRLSAILFLNRTGFPFNNTNMSGALDALATFCNETGCLN